MNKRPKNLDKQFGYCTKPNHGVFFNKENGCIVCKTETKRKKDGLCCATLRHGPGHQSKTYCEVKGKHTIHQCTYGSYDDRATWKGSASKIKFTGYFDEPPIVRE